MPRSERGELCLRVVIALLCVCLTLAGAYWLRLAFADPVNCECGGASCGCPADDPDDEVEPEWCGGAGMSCSCGGTDCSCQDSSECSDNGPHEPCGGAQEAPCACGGTNCGCDSADRCLSAGGNHQPCEGAGHTCECNGAGCACQSSSDCKENPYSPCSGAAEDSCGCEATFGCDNCEASTRCNELADPYEPCGGSTANWACECTGAKCSTSTNCVEVTKCNDAPNPYQPCEGKQACTCNGTTCSGTACGETCIEATEVVCKTTEHPSGRWECTCGCGVCPEPCMNDL